MCCSTVHHPISRHCMGMPAVHCGCGCIGREQTARNLENYREYLKQELASVERQIQSAAPKTDQ